MVKAVCAPACEDFPNKRHSYNYLYFIEEGNMKETKDYGKLFLWLGTLSLFFVCITSLFYQNALLIGMAVSFLFNLISLIIYSRARK